MRTTFGSSCDPDDSVISRPKIAVLEYGMGNWKSVEKAFERVGADAVPTKDERELWEADGIAIVGVGAFPTAMQKISDLGLDRVLTQLNEAKKPILGICLGLQLLFEGSEEHNGARGLGFLRGEVKRLETGGRRLPHIGWNPVQWRKPSRLLAGLPEESVYYHVHSYVAKPDDEDVILGTSSYGEEFVSCIEHDNLFGVQFHPEKSSTYGLTMLDNFAKICGGAELEEAMPSGPASTSLGLRKRIIPCLDVDGGRVVKGTNFVDLRDAGDPIELAKRYDAAGADEIAFLDITATHEKRDTMVQLAAEAVERVFVPITIGGGIRSVNDAQAVLNAGADNVSINSAAVANPPLVDELAAVYANQNIVLALDAKRKPDDSGWHVYVGGGRKLAYDSDGETPLDAVEWAEAAVTRGAGQVLLTSMDRDGTQAGYDLDLIQAVAGAVDVPVIASGGAGAPEHLEEGLEAGADAVLCASIFHYGHYSVQDIKDHLAQSGIPVTPPSPPLPAEALAVPG